MMTLTLQELPSISLCLVILLMARLKGVNLLVESLESDKELTNLLLDVEEAATAGVDLSDDDDILEVRDDNQSDWTLD